MTTPAEPDWTRRTRPVEFTELHILGPIGNPGAMGTVYRVAGRPPCLFKKYVNPPVHVARLDRLVTWRNSLSGEAREFLDSRCAWPLVAVTENGQIVGFLMRSAPDEFWADMGGELHTVELQHLIHTAGAKAFGIGLPGPEQRLALVESLADTLAFLEAHEFVYGDVNERNVLWTLKDRPRVFLIDCDNARPAALPAASAGVAMPRNANWRDPDLPEGGYPDINSDRYTLAVFCYRAFYEYYLRPGTAKASLDDDRNKILLPDEAPRLPELERALSYGLGRPHTRPAGAQWISAIKGVDLSEPQPDFTVASASAPTWPGEQHPATWPRRPPAARRPATRPGALAGPGPPVTPGPAQPPPPGTLARLAAAAAAWGGRNRSDRQRLMAGLAIAGAVALFLLVVFIIGLVEPTSQSHSSGSAAPIPAGGSSAPDSPSAASASSDSAGSPDASGSDPATAVSASPSDSGSAPSGSAVPASPGSSTTLNPGSFALPMGAAPGNASLTNACRWQYRDNPDAMAEPVAGSNPIASYAVQCFDGGSDLGGLNLDGYCDSLVSGMQAYNPDRYGPASDQPPPWDQWECVPG